MVEDLIRRARRRFLLNEALAQLALAAAFAAAGISLLLLLGTNYLEWWTVAFLTGIGILVGVVLVCRHVPTPYAMAVRLDINANLKDTLSTALHFASHAAASENFRRGQRAQAEAVARTVELEHAVPFTLPRALYAMAALSLLASGLFTLRYRVSKVLDLRPPITQVLFEDQAVSSASKQQKANEIAKRAGAAQSLLAKLGLSLNQENQKPPDALDKAIEQAVQSQANQDRAGAKGASPSGEKASGKSGESSEPSQDGDPLDGAQPASSSKTSDTGAPGSQEGASGDEASSKGGNPADNSSLLSKLKDAVSNIFSKAKQDGGGSGQKGQSGQQMAKSDRGNNAEKGSAGKGQQQSQSQADSQDGDPNGDAQDGQQAQGKSGGKDSTQQTSSQPGSGIGRQDGSKDLKAAEQIRAMGKISEIIGKRAQTVTGETTVEVQSGSQQLRTAFSSSRANHGEADGDVSRDEIPLGLQAYVQQYFAEVRKSAPVSRQTAKNRKATAPTP